MWTCRLIWACLALLLIAAGLVFFSLGGRVRREVVVYSSSFDGTGPLHAACFYTALALRPKPIVVVMHGYSGSYSTVEWTARRLAKAGFLAVCPNMRGRVADDGTVSAGRRDDGGREILDIYDAIAEAVRRYRFADGDNVNIVGYSGGGGNALSAVTKLPETFRWAVSYFGISDYAAWYRHAAEYAPRVAAAVGGTPDEVPDKYAARNSAEAAANARATRVLLFWDSEEKVCQPEMDRRFIEVARQAGLDNVVGYESRPGDRYRWVHGRPRDNRQLIESEKLFWPGMKGGGPPPRMPDEGVLTVPGYVIMRDFRFFPGNWDDVAGRLSYKRGPGGMAFAWTVTTSDKSVEAVLEVLPPSGASVSAVRAGGEGRPFEVDGDWVRIEGIRHGDRIEVDFAPRSADAGEKGDG